MRNVILITLDAFQYDLALENLGKLKHLSGLIERSVSFRNAFSIGPFTFTSFPGIISGVYPYYFGSGAPPEVDTIASVLKKHAYSTARINESTACLSPYYGYDKGVDFQMDFIQMGHHKRARELSHIFQNKKESSENLRPRNRLFDVIRESLPDFAKLGRKTYLAYQFLLRCLEDPARNLRERRELHMSFKRAIKRFIVTDFKEPQFLWIHATVNHAPYLPPDGSSFSENEINHLNNRVLAHFMSPETAENVKKLYVESFRTTDLLLRDIIVYLSSQNLLRNSILIVTSDHGEEFMEDGKNFGHVPDSSSDRLLRVPLIFYSQDLEERSREIRHPVSTLDIFPTVMEALDINPPSTVRGLSLKRFILGQEDREAVTALLNRPLYSEAWEVDTWLNRSPGYTFSKRIFTVRKSRHKLTVRIENSEGMAIERYELVDWQTGEPLGMEENIGVCTELLHLLRKHLYEEYIFSSNLKSLREKERVRNALKRINL